MNKKIDDLNISKDKKDQYKKLLKEDKLLKEEKKSIKQTLKNVNADDLEVEYKRNKFDIIQKRNQNVTLQT